MDREGLLSLARKWLSPLCGLDADGRREFPRFIGHNAFRGFMEAIRDLFAEISYDVETIYADIEAQTVALEMTSFRLVLPEQVPYSNR